MSLDAQLLIAVKRSPDWFGKAAKGLKDSSGEPLTGKRKAEGLRPRKRRQQITIRDFADGICGPREPGRITAWVTEGGRVLDPAARLWSGE